MKRNSVIAIVCINLFSFACTKVEYKSVVESHPMTPRNIQGADTVAQLTVNYDESIMQLEKEIGVPIILDSTYYPILAYQYGNPPTGSMRVTLEQVSFQENVNRGNVINWASQRHKDYYGYEHYYLVSYVKEFLTYLADIRMFLGPAYLPRYPLVCMGTILAYPAGLTKPRGSYLVFGQFVINGDTVFAIKFVTPNTVWSSGNNNNLQATTGLLDAKDYQLLLRDSQ